MLLMTLGGYDESMEAMAYQDNDLLIRSMLIGLSYIHLPDPEFNRAIPNDKSESLKNTSSGLSWKEMKNKNFALSINNISKGRFQANSHKDSIGITDNISTFVDDDYFSTNTIQLLPIGGLCNRMRVLDSAICLAKEINFDLTVYWEPNRFLNCPFELLFCPIEGIEIKTIRANTFRLMGDGTYDLYNSNVFRKYESMKYIGAKELIDAEDRMCFICIFYGISSTR